MTPGPTVRSHGGIMNYTSIVPLILLQLCAGACSSDSSDGQASSSSGGAGAASAGGAAGVAGTGAPGGTGASAGTGGVAAVSWFPCSLQEGEDDGLAECARTPMPLYRAPSPSDETMDIYAKRWLSQESSSQGQLWMLEGGPGGSGVMNLPDYMEILREGFPGWDLYVLDARGTGYSSYLGCPTAEALDSDSGEEITDAELPDCITELEQTLGDRLQAYRTTDSAADLRDYIALTREPGKPVFIWGGSGGTYWAQRYLQLEPNAVDGVILEGIAPATFSMRVHDAEGEAVGRAILAQCQSDTFCSSRLPDPLATASALKQKLAGGHCSELEIDHATVMAFAFQLAYFRVLNSLIPAVLFRIDRCSDADLEFLAGLADWFGDALTEEGSSSSEVLFLHETMSELWDDPRFEDEASFRSYLDGVYADAVISASGSGYHLSRRFELWPRYSDPLDNQWAQTDVPLLMLQGQIDPATPHSVASVMQEHFTGAHQRYVALPHSAHDALLGSPTSDGSICGAELLAQFLEDPRAELDTSCTQRVLPLDFEGTQYAPQLFGATNYWDDEPIGNARIITRTATPMVQKLLRTQPRRGRARSLAFSRWRAK